MLINEVIVEYKEHPIVNKPTLETVLEWGGSRLKHSDIPMVDRKRELEIHQSEKPDIFKTRDRSSPAADALQQYVRGSKTFNDYLHKLHKGERQMPGDIDQVTGPGKSYYTAKLAGTPELVNMIHLLDDLLTSNRLKDNYVLYTGVKQSPAELWAKTNTPNNSPLVVHLPAYTSTTTNWDKARAHADKAAVDYTQYTPRNVDAPKKITKPTAQIIKINAPKGTPGTTARYAGSRDFTEENEILLARGLNIQIDPHPTVVRGVTVWHANIVGHEPIVVDLPQK